MAYSLLTAPAAVAKAFSPGHITGFFEIPHTNTSDFLHAGSKGAGFSVARGIETSVRIYEDGKSGYRISINGKRTSDAEVSRWVIEQYQGLAGNRPFFAKVDHDVGIPVGFGLGSSGSAALSLSYALNYALNIGLSKERAAQLAHRAEIACRTGLGTVIAEYVGGFEMRLRAGAPGVGEVITMNLDNYRAVVLCLAPISTKSFLTSRIGEINGLGGTMLRKLSATKSVDDFLKMSHDFAKALGLIDGSCSAPIASLAKRGFNASVALFGQTVFTLVPSSSAREAADALEEFGGTLFVCRVDTNGARVL